MLIADDFVFLHIPKTGGTFVQRVISEHLPDVDIGLYTHTCYDDFPEDARHLPGFYVIRNPTGKSKVSEYDDGVRICGPVRRLRQLVPWKIDKHI